MMVTDKINFKQPKYVLPLVVFLPLLVTAYFVFDLFDTQPVEEKSALETTDYLNSNLPQANIKDDGIGNRYENMLKSYGDIQDYSAVEGIDKEDSTADKKEDYSSKYSNRDKALLNADVQQKAQELERLKAMQERIQAGAAKGRSLSESGAQPAISENERQRRTWKRQDEEMQELDRALAKARLEGRNGASPTQTVSPKTESAHIKTKGKIDEKAETKEVVKATDKTSDYFNTISVNDPEPHLIKAIIDENITAVDGSRLRLRLLDDVVIGEQKISKGTYLYAIVSGFGSQRMKGNVQSILMDDELIKVNLSIYDTDGLEGLYIPESKFRETAKDVTSGAIGGETMNFDNNAGSGNTFKQWGIQALNNAYRTTTSAISSGIKKNKAKLKYGSFVYLMNGKGKGVEN